jgi:hypothetical protein
VSIKCLLPGLGLFSTVLIADAMFCHRRQGRPEPTLSIQSKSTGLSRLMDSPRNDTQHLEIIFAKTAVYGLRAPIFGVPKS